MSWGNDQSGSGLSVHTNNIVDLHGAGVDGSANQLLTDDGDGSVTSESSLTYLSETLSIGNDDDDIAIIQRSAHSDGGGGTLMISGGNAVSGQTDQTGGDLRLVCGAPTGDAEWGDISFWGGVLGTSGTTLNSPRTLGAIKSGSTLNEFYLYEPYDGSTDSLRIAVAANAATTIATSDDDGTVGHITIDADGDITLDAASGNIYAKDNGGNYTPGSDYEIATKKYVDDNAGGSDGWHGSTTRIKILPRDFVANDIGRPLMIEDDSVGSNELFLHSFGSGDMFAYVPVPTGYKATHVMIYGSDTGQDFYVYAATINTKTILDVATGATSIGTEKALATQVTSTTTNYLIVRVTSDGATDEIYGGYVTIAAV